MTAALKDLLAFLALASFTLSILAWSDLVGQLS